MISKCIEALIVGAAWNILHINSSKRQVGYLPAYHAAAKIVVEYEY